MNTIVELFIIFVTLSFFFILKMPNLSDAYFIYKKILIFFILMITLILLNLIINYAYKQKSSYNILLIIIYGLVGVIGYNTYVDVVLSDMPLSQLVEGFIRAKYSRDILVAFIITAHIAIIKIIILLFNYNTNIV
jgi:hypothetical protein